MESLVSNSTLLYSLPVPPARTVTCNSKFRNLSFRLQNRRKPGLKFCGSFSSIRTPSITCGVTEVNESQFPDVVLRSDRPVLVEFVANWCGPCRLMAPAVECVAQEYREKLLVVKIDHDSNPRLIEEYKVYGLPALILFQNGREVPNSRTEGALTKVKLKSILMRCWNRSLLHNFLKEGI